MGELRVTQVDDSSVMRLVILDPQEPEKLQIAANLELKAKDVERESTQERSFLA